jgi:hypothetical protein
LLTLRGAAGESIGHDHYLKSNTIKTPVRFLFRQGCMFYDLIPNMPDERLRPLRTRFGELLSEQSAFTEVFGII